MSIKKKLTAAKNLILSGQYGEFLRRTCVNVLPLSLDFYPKYYYLRRKFSSFVANYDYVKPLAGGGA